ncbi:hypothetical protein PXNS11_290143 [Stutzerimonas xanthomarina]|nr:hypothetical protein PXNS11_290143 [Stutzerimonas xanthomarina]
MCARICCTRRRWNANRRWAWASCRLVSLQAERCGDTLAPGESIGQSLSLFVPQKGREESPGSIGRSAR